MRRFSSSLKILYGVQATGQGHITRARVMAPALSAIGANVDFVFSGRKPEELYNMEPFGDFQTRRGLTFHTENGKISNFKTLFNNSAARLIGDIRDMDVKSYDLVITDYEPIVAWAAKLRGVPSIGIGHQYAFHHDVPTEGFNALSRLGMKEFAPTQQSLGVHWHHFNQPILPPIFEPPETGTLVQDNKIVVYLNFETVEDISNLLTGFPEYDFYIYGSGVKQPYDLNHLKFRPTSEKFKADIENCAGIICGAGFELATEALHMGKKLLVKPLSGQPEQLSNALALKKLGLGNVMQTLDPKILKEWLETSGGNKVIYPDTPTAVANWIKGGNWQDSSALVKELWGQVKGLEHIR